MSERLSLEDLRVDHADEMVDVLASPELYAITGGTPPTIDDLRRRYELQVAGPGRTDEEWRNWIVRVDGRAVGFVQATVTGTAATLAWLIGVRWQGRGHAKAAVADVCDLLREQGIDRFDAWIAPGHVASERVAASAGLRRTDQTDDDGEVRWKTP
ncbi:MAG: GNAT family N-acetyltransferase [Actinomycetota bacterium]